MFRFKNETSSKICLAFAYFARKKGCWISKGWWTIEPGYTAIPYSKKLKNQYYYYYAFNDTGQYSGDKKFCVVNTPFKIKEADRRCNGRWKNFKQVNVGNSKTYILRLTDNSGSELSEKDQQFINMWKNLKNNN